MFGKRISNLLGKITILLIICCCCLPVRAKYGGGTGEPNDPYLIAEPNDIIEMSWDPSNWDKHFLMIADVDMIDHTLWAEIYSFSGVFDGAGHKILNLTIYPSWFNAESHFLGLFGKVSGEQAQVMNLGLENVSITGYDLSKWCGGLTGWNEGIITNCYATGSVKVGLASKHISGLCGINHGTISNCSTIVSVRVVEYSVPYGDLYHSLYIGGLCGENKGSISQCYATGSVSMEWLGPVQFGHWSGVVGGLCGGNSGTISECYAKGSVSGESQSESFGGLCGTNGGTIRNCYSEGSVQPSGYPPSNAPWSIGGLCGYNNYYGTINNCYSKGSLLSFWGGGLVGDNGGSLSNCFWDIQTSGKSTSSGGTGKTTSEMQNSATFFGWGFCGNGGVWTIEEGEYPRLAWEGVPGEPIGPYAPVYGGGTGEPNDPYLIYTSKQLNTIGLIPCHLDKHFKLMADIDLSGYTGTSFNIIGYYISDYDNKPFTGVFDGNGHTISNFTYSSTGTGNIGLFGYVRGGKVKDLGLIDPNVDAGTGFYVGSLVGWLINGTITACYAEVASVSGRYWVGGLVGRNGGTITNCFSTGSVLGDEGVGGLCGENSGTISNCYSEGDVSGTTNVGGLVGTHDWDTITNCYSTGSVLGDSYVGGLVGGGSGYVGGSYWDIESSGQSTSAGGTGKTKAEMKMASTFTWWGVCGNQGVWTINDGNDYPRLAWQNLSGVLIVTSEPIYGGGSGNEADPYQIRTAEQLNTIGLIPCHLDKHFKLMTDIDLSQYTGTEFNIITNFTGVFDGNGHTISNFTYTSTVTNFIGLFGYVDDPNAEIKNLGLIDPNVDAGTGDYVGSLVGYLSRYGTISDCYVEGGSVSGRYRVGGLVGRNDGTITNCYSTVSVSGTGWDVGGLVGNNGGYSIITNCYSTGSVEGVENVGGLVGCNNYYYSTITNCYATGSVLGVENVGGLVGNSYSTITNCYATGSVLGNNNIGGNVGGLVGKNSSGTITNCYAIGSVLGNYKVGGLVGCNYYYSTITNCYAIGSVLGNYNVGGLVGGNFYYSTITNCYSTARVSGNENVGGLVGYNDYKSTVTSSFWDIETSGQTTSAGGTGLPTAEMQMASTFTDAGWDFLGEIVNGIEDNWFIPQGDYPHLWWEGMRVPMKLTPVSLNCRSEGNWVKAHLTLTQGFSVADVDSDRAAVLHSFGFQSAPQYVFVNKDKLVEIEAAFEREQVCSLTGNWPEELTVAGFLSDGNIFLGTSNVRIIYPGMKVIEELTSCWLQGVCVYPEIDMNRDSLVNLLDYASLMNINVEFVTDE